MIENDMVIFADREEWNNRFVSALHQVEKEFAQGVPLLEVPGNAMPYRIGFTGTSKGMTLEQIARVRSFLAKYLAEGATEFHHGLCIGADEQAAWIAKELGFRVIAHPGFNPRNPTSRLYRSDFKGNDEVRPEKPFIKRDHDIVDETDRMIAAPLSAEEQIRSGTWTTYRYAKRTGKPIELVLP